jgi:hypothetical protein
MTTLQPEPQPEPPGVVITDDYVTPSVPRLVAEDDEMLDEASTPHDDDVTPDSFTSAVPAVGGALVGSPTTITDPDNLDDGDLDENGNRTER